MGEIQVSERLISFLTFLPMFFLSITIHEFAHAFSASKLGDDTAKSLGRLTLNPIKHADVIGTLVMPIISFASGFALIGWAKPVPVNRNNFRNLYRDDAIVSAAGPFSNFVLAIVFFAAFFIAVSATGDTTSFLVNTLFYGMFFNIFLCLFNLLPIPPLDGSHILFDLFPNKITAGILNLGLYGSIILILFIYSPLWGIFMKLVNFILRIFLQIAGL